MKAQLKNGLRFAITSFLIALCAEGSVAQNQKMDLNSPKMVDLSTKQSLYKGKSVHELFAKELNLRKDDELQSIRLDIDDIGFTHERFQQTFKGVKVEFGDYILHRKLGELKSMNGSLINVPADLDVKAKLTEAQALAFAMKFIDGKVWEWEVEKNATKPKGQLVICPDYSVADETPVLAYKFDLYAYEPLSRSDVYVDAQSGKIIFNHLTIKHAAVDGTFNTRLSGTKTCKTDSYGGTYRLRDPSRGNGIETYNLNKGNNYGAATDFTDANNSWTTAEFDNANKDNAALDAHYGAQKTYDYFSVTHSRNSYDNLGGTIKGYVHYSVDYINAYWDGTKMTYGDCKLPNWEPLVSVDIVGHELGHAVCQSTCNLQYKNESGAMNEAFSDIWGACVESYAKDAGNSGDTDKNIWLIAEESDFRPTGHVALRSMSDPNVENQPDTYKGTLWRTGTDDNGGVHYNSGVLNHWFYILSVGKSGTNDIGNSYAVTGITMAKAAKIAYRLETNYLTSTSQYADARTLGIAAAIDLYGAGSAEVIATTNAFYAVGLGSLYSISYCNLFAGSASTEWIESTSFVGQTTTSGSSGTVGYQDYTGTTINLSIGIGQAFTLTPAFLGGTTSEFFRIWIDLNGDGDFVDTGETVYSSAATTTAVSSSITIPSTVTPKVTRMRVSMKSGSLAATPCTNFSYGEVEDYTVSLNSITGCNYPTSVAASTVSQTSAGITWAAVTSAVSYNVQYKLTSGSTWTTVNTTSTTLNLTGLTAGIGYDVKVSTVCSGSSSAYSPPTSFTTIANTISYCSANGNSSGEWIDYVKVGSIERTSTAESGGYYNGTSAFSTNLTLGRTYTLTLSAGFASGAYAEYFTAYIDYNRNGIFESTEKAVQINTTTAANVSKTFIVPGAASLGQSRMRLVMAYGAYVNSPCGATGYGEVEDYTVNLSATLMEEDSTDIEPLMGRLEIENEAKIVASPNPSKDGFFNIVAMNTSENLSVKIISVTGAVLLETKLDGLEKRIDLSALAAGIYFLEATDGDKHYREKIITTK